jgi:phage tail-like protein
VTYPKDQTLALLGVDAARVVPLGHRLALILRDPQPDELGIARDAAVRLTVVDLGVDPADPPLALTAVVWIDQGAGEVLAYDGATFQPGWDGPASARRENTGTDPYRFVELVLDQSPAVFPSLAPVIVRVYATAAAGFGHLPFGHFPFGHGSGLDWKEFLYAFGVADYTAPRLLTAEGRSPFVARVTYSKAMGPSALDPASYAVAVYNVDPQPAVPLAVVSVAQVSPTVYDLTFDWEQTPGAPYRVTSSAADAVGNAIDTAAVGATVTDSTTYPVTPGVGVLGVRAGRQEVPQWIDFLGTETTAAAIAARINALIVGARATVVGGNVSIATDIPGAGVYLQVANPTADPLLIFPTAEAEGKANDEADWLGFQPLVPADRDWSIWEQMPRTNRIEDDRGTMDLRRLCNVIDEVLGWHLYDVDHFTDRWDPDLAADDQVEAMLADLGNPFYWFEDLSPVRRRKLLRLLVPICKQKGTAPGIVNVARFLLGVGARVLPHDADGWILGVDLLGAGTPATALSEADPFDLSGGPTLTVQVDWADPLAITFADGMFADPAAATAAEVATAIDAALRAYDVPGFAEAVGAQVAIASSDGQWPAQVSDDAAYPVPLAAGATLLVRVGTGGDQTLTFVGTETTAADVAARIAATLVDGSAAVVDGQVRIRTDAMGHDARLEVLGGTANAVLDFPTVPVIGRGGTTAAGEPRVEVSAGGANDALGFPTDPQYGARAATLAVASGRALYTFDVEVDRVLTAGELAALRRIIEYMKVAHEHLGLILEPTAEPVPDHWSLGESLLGDGTILHA